jgi:hydroxyethylthiazole kinase-like uncharacterized protein yjeF
VQPALTSAEMAALDRYTIEQVGLSGRILMASAARECLRILRERWPECRRPLILAGPGNNGGDGIALAYYAQATGLEPTLTLCAGDDHAYGADPAYFLSICERAFVPTLHLAASNELAALVADPGADLIVDALFGTGLDRPLSQHYIDIIGRINAVGLPALAVDCPSGLDCASGMVQGAVVRSDCTVTFGYPKRGFFHAQALEHLGDVIVAGLGFAALADAGVSPASHAWPDALWKPLREPRPLNSHKGGYGKLLVVAGHSIYPGAPRLATQAAEAALHSGAGLVRLVVPESIHAICSAHASVMCAPHAEDGQGGFAAEPSAALLEWLDWCDALVLGPGMGDGEQPARLAAALLAECQCPVVLDADGLRALDSRGGAVLRPLVSGPSMAQPLPGGWPLVLTPHLGELARLAGVKPQALDAGLFGHAVAQAQRHTALVLAKSAQPCLVSPSGALLFPHRGHPVLATGGTGDVLSGMLGALLARWHAGVVEAARPPNHAAREMEAAEIVCTAVNWHSAASHLWAETHGENGMTAVDLIHHLPDALLHLVAQHRGSAQLA